MNNKWVVFAVFVWIIGMFLGSTFEYHTDSDWVGADKETTLEYLLDAKNISYSQSDTGTWNFVGFNTEYFTTLWSVMTFDFTFFNDDVNSGTEMIRWIIFVPVAIGVIYGVLYAFIQLIQGFIPFT